MRQDSAFLRSTLGVLYAYQNLKTLPLDQGPSSFSAHQNHLEADVSIVRTQSTELSPPRVLGLLDLGWA